MRRLLLSLSAGALVLGLTWSPSASAQQSLSLYLGGFAPKAIDARGTDDVLFQDDAFLSTVNRTDGIDMGQFSNVTVGGEWLFGIGRNLDGGLGLGFYQRSVPTTYTNLVNVSGAEVQQTLKLRIVPFTATIRFLPLGRDQPIQPYIGAGVGVYAWRYSESGQFVDDQNNIITGTFVGSGGATGPVILGGVRVPVSSLNLGGEVRWQGGSATLPADQGFAGSKIDLGGISYLLTVDIRF